MTYLLIGPPASGKGTQAELLAKKLDLPYFSVGALLRSASETDPSIAAAIHSGELVPDSIVVQLLCELHEKHPDNVILDGAIRTSEQVDTILRIWDTSRIIVIHIELTDHIIRERASKRVEGGHKRLDDALKVVDRRIADYRASIDHIIHHLQSHDIKVCTVSGNSSIEGVHQEIMDSLYAYSA